MIFAFKLIFSTISSLYKLFSEYIFQYLYFQSLIPYILDMSLTNITELDSFLFSLTMSQLFTIT
jgi:hypothetical protein